MLVQEEQKSAASLLNLPQDIILHGIVPHLTCWEVACLSQTCSRWRRDLASVTYLETAWKAALRTRGFGRTLIDTSKTWKSISLAIIYHSDRCRACRTIMQEYTTKQREIDNRKLPHNPLEEEPEPLPPSFEAMPILDAVMHPFVDVMDGLKAVRNLAGPSNIRLEYNTAAIDAVYRPGCPLLAVFGALAFEDRCRLSIPATMLNLIQDGHDDDSARRFIHSLTKEVSTELSDQRLSDQYFSKKYRIDSHIVVSSLFALTLPVESAKLVVRDDADPPLGVWDHDWWVNDNLHNETGITLLDLTRAAFGWSGYGSMKKPHKRPRCMQPFEGCHWDYGSWGQPETAAIVLQYEERVLNAEREAELGGDDWV